MSVLGVPHHETRFSSWLLWQAHPHSHRANPAGRVDGLRLGLDRRGVWQRRRHLGCLCIGSDQQDPGRYRHHADARAHPGHVCHDRHVTRSALGRPLYCRPWRLRPAGGRRLARRALRQTRDPHQGIYPDHAQDLRARGPGGIWRPDVPDAQPERGHDWTRQASEVDPRRSLRYPHLYRLYYPCRPALCGRSRRWRVPRVDGSEQIRRAGRIYRAGIWKSRQR